MPRIPIINAEGNAAVANFPRVPNLPEGGAGAIIGRSLEKTGGVVADIGNRLDAQAAESELVKMGSEYDAGLTQIHSDVFTNKDIKDPAEEFTRRAGELQAQLRQNSQRASVHRAFDMHASRVTPRAIVGVRMDDLKLKTQQRIADVNESLDILSQAAATAEVPEDRDAAIRTGQDMLQRAEGRKIFNPIQRQEAQQKFETQILEKNMDYLARTNRSQLYFQSAKGVYDKVDSVKRLKILEQARVAGEQEETRADANFRKVSDAVERQWGGLANTGSLPDAWLEEALQNGNPNISPAKARVLDAINRNPPIGGGKHNVSVRAIMEEYGLKFSTMENIRKAREALKNYRDNLTGPDPTGELEKAGLKLASDERAMLGIQNTQLNNAIKAGTDAVQDDPMWALLGSKLGAMLKQQNNIVQAKVRELIRKGMRPEDAVKKAMEGAKQRGDATPERNQKVLRVLP